MVEQESLLDIAAIVEEVATETGVHATDLTAQTRGQAHTSKARMLLTLTLSRAGLNPAEIARALTLNHSTVVHRLAQIATDPDMQHHADRILARAGAPGMGLNDQLAHILSALPAGQHAAVAACISCTVLMREMLAAPLCMHGLSVLAANERIRHQVQTALWHAEHRGHAEHIDRLIAMAAYPRAGAAWRSPEQPPDPPVLDIAEIEPPVQLPENVMAKVELIDPGTIPARAQANDRASRLADARMNLRRAHAASQALKLHLDEQERSAPIVSAYAAAAKDMGLRVRCNLDGQRDYVGRDKKKRTDATIIYVRILGGKLAAVAS